MKKKVAKLVMSINLMFPLILSAQYDSPTLYANSDVKDIIIENCKDLKPISFQSGFLTTWESGIHKWTLYRDNIEVSNKTQLILCDLDCWSTCELPAVNFEIEPESGNYTIRLEITKYKFIGVGCTGLWINTNLNSYDMTSSPLNVHVYDMSSYCNCLFPFDATVNCEEVTFKTGFLNDPYALKVVNNIVSNCSLGSSANSTTLIAGKSIKLNSGFYVPRGNNFISYIEKCDNGSNKSLQTSNANIDELTLNSSSNESKTDLEKLYSNQPDDDITIYPNPTNNFFTVKTPANIYDSECLVSIIDVFGKVCFCKNFKAMESIHINVTDFQKGLYYVQIKQPANNFIKKLIVN